MDLDQLIETERRNDELLRRAVAEGATIVQAAKAAAAARAATVADELARINAADAREVAAERERRLAAIVEAGRADAARYAAITEHDIVLTARALVPGLLIDGEWT